MKIKSLRFLNLIAVAILAAFVTSCGGLNTMLKKAPEVTYSVTPSVLEMHGDSVEIKVKGQYPPKFFNKKAVMEVTPVLVYEGGEKAFKTETIQGEAVEAGGTIIAFDAGGSFSYTSKIPYVDGMEKSELKLRVKAKVKEKEVEFPETKLADGVITTPLLLKNKAESIEAMDQFKRRQSITKEAKLLFLINRSNIRSSELKGEDYKLLNEFVDKAKEEDNHEFMGVEIASYASPDGKEDLNERLAKNRSKASTSLIKKELKKVEEMNKEGFLSENMTAEDWDGLKKLVSTSNVEDKELVLKVLSMYSNPVEREKELRRLSKAFEGLAEEVLPQLRRSEFRVKVDVVGKSDSLLLAIGKDANATDTLNIEEFLKAATLAENAADKETILTNATARQAEEWRAYNNLGCVQAEAGKLDAAQGSFDKANELSEGNAAVKNNLGAVAYMKGDVEKALAYFEEATGAGKAVSHNKGMIALKRSTGDYNEAVQLFGSSKTFNAALAKVLNGDNTNALKILGSIDNTDDPYVFYLKAIIGARSANDELVFENLRTAVEKDASIKAKAKKDLEFAKYFENATFKAIVQ